MIASIAMRATEMANEIIFGAKAVSYAYRLGPPPFEASKKGGNRV